MSDVQNISFGDPYRVFDRNSLNLDSHQLIWFGMRDTTSIQNLRKIIDYTKVFNSIQECKKYIEVTNNSTTTFFVCSKLIAEEIISQIHHFESVKTIYVVDENQEYHHQQLPISYSKIKQVYRMVECLLNELEEDVKDYLKHENNCKSIWTKNFDKEGNTTAFASASRKQFMELLFYLPYPENSRQKVIDSLKDYYAEKAAELKLLDEFEDVYIPETAVWWYTRPTFLYRLINKALRHTNTEIMFLFGFFVQDIYQKLQEEHEKLKIAYAEKPIIKVYRGQMMHKDEINIMKFGNYPLINNSFLSTTFDRSLALIFLNPSTNLTDEFRSVLFEIEIDTRRKSLPYGDIANLSHVPDELECLFLPGTTFTKIIGDSYKDDYEDGNILIVRLKLEDTYCAEEKDLDNATTNKRRFLKNSIAIFTNPNYKPLPQEFDAFFDGLLNLYPLEKQWILAIKYHCYAPYSGLDSSKILSYYEKALSIWQKYTDDDELNCHSDLGHLYKAIGNYYQYQIKDLLAANKQYSLAINHYKIAANKLCTNYEQISIFSCLSSIYQEKMKIENDENRIDNCLMAITYREQQIKKLSSNNAKKSGPLLQNIAYLYQAIGNYDNALDNYGKAIETFDGDTNESLFEIYKECVHISIEYKQNYQLALKYQLQYHRAALEFYTNEEWNTSDIPNSHLYLGKIYLALNQDDLANQNFITAIELYEKKKRLLEYNMTHLTGSFAEEVKNEIRLNLEKINYIQTLINEHK